MVVFRADLFQRGDSFFRRTRAPVGRIVLRITEIAFDKNGNDLAFGFPVRDHPSGFHVSQSLLDLLSDILSVLNFFQSRFIRKLLKDFSNDFLDGWHGNVLALICCGDWRH